MYVLHFYYSLADLGWQFIWSNLQARVERIIELSLYLHLAGGPCDVWSQQACVL